MLVGLAWWLGTVFVQAGGFDWRLPMSHYASVDDTGCVSYWQKLSDVDFGDHLRLPLVVGFRTRYEDGPPSAYLGRNWIMPLLESRIVQWDENKFELLKIDGTTTILRRDGAAALHLNGDDGCTAAIHGNTINVSMDGWAADFTEGRLVALRAPNGRQLRFQRFGIDENGVVKFAVAPASGSEGNLSLRLNGKEPIVLEMGNRPVVRSIAGKNVISGLARSLSAVQFPGGDSIAFDYSPDKEGYPTLHVSGSDNEKKSFRWDALTKHVLSDGEWTYHVRPLGPNAGFAEISRVNPQGQQESWCYDDARAEEATTDVNRSTEVIQWFASGEMAGYPRRIVRTENGSAADGTKSVSSIHFSYDKEGRPLRIVVKKTDLPEYTLTVNKQTK